LKAILVFGFNQMLSGRFRVIRVLLPLWFKILSAMAALLRMQGCIHQ
jgi:hypothetical protein